jgi:glycosyltransferase involved in cell wall biosynthesis
MISIALATYNGEKYVREQLDFILNQTHQDFWLK